MSVPTTWRHWIEAARPKTLPAAIIPVMVGTALAVAHQSADYGKAAICLAFALLVQIGTNFANDYFDFVKGADTAERVGPRRAVAAGLIAPARMLTATIVAAHAMMNKTTSLKNGDEPCAALDGVLDFSGAPAAILRCAALRCASAACA